MNPPFNPNPVITIEINSKYHKRIIQTAKNIHKILKDNKDNCEIYYPLFEVYQDIIEQAAIFCNVDDHIRTLVEQED